ncbi:MAG: hypothetical protein WCK77_21840 [Verrucomicrobiota bacterium]
MSTWLINDTLPSSLGLRVVGGEFRSGAASTVRLESSALAFDADATVFAYEQAVAVKRDGALLFQGTVREVPRSGSAAEETQAFVISDAWALLEKVTYQEIWIVNGGSVYLPQVVLGMDHLGNRIDVGAQIGMVIAYAAGVAGVSIQCGTMPTGLDLWPSEAVGQSCAEVIRTSLRYHPDWLCWIDHSTSPPTFNVTPRAEAAENALGIGECSAIKIAEKSDLLPQCVRIVYTCATTVDDTVYRDYAVDKYPTSGSDSGPGTLTTVIELAGGQASVAKQQVETVDLPVAGGDASANQAAFKAFIKQMRPDLNYVAAAVGPPAIPVQGIQDSSFIITEYTPRLMVDGNTRPAAVNPNATRMELRSLDDAPRILVGGTLHEWMRKRSGKVCVRVTASPTPTATAAEIELLRNLNEHLITYTGTNAETKIYKGQPQWRTIAESVPAGIAELYYTTINQGCRWEGSVTLTDTVGAMWWLGSTLDLADSGESSTWANMRAPIHSISWDAQTEKCTLSFGPNPHYSPQDFVEYLRLLRKRAVTWWTAAERTSAELGCQADPSAKGDHVGPVILPRHEPVPPLPSPLPALWVSIVKEGNPGSVTYKAIVGPGKVLERHRAAAAGNMIYWEPSNRVVAAVGGAPATPTRFTATVGQAIYIKMTESIPGTAVSACTIITGADTLESVETAGTSVVFNYKLATFIALPDGSTGVAPCLAGSDIYHWPEGKGLDLVVQTWGENASHVLSYMGSGYDVTHYWRKGMYVGNVDPGTAADNSQIIAKIIAV